jgi:Fe-S cluster biogenesis protein NfuA
MYSESARKVNEAIANWTAYIETHSGTMKVLGYDGGEVTVEPTEWSAGCYHTFRFMFGMIRYPE